MAMEIEVGPSRDWREAAADKGAAYALRMIRARFHFLREQEEDIAQDVALECLASPVAYVGDPTAWAQTVAWRLICNRSGRRAYAYETRLRRRLAKEANAPSDPSPLPDASVADAQDVATRLALLKPMSRRVLSMVLGLEDGVERTHGEVAATLGLTRQRVQQIYAGAIAHLRAVASP